MQKQKYKSSRRKYKCTLKTLHLNLKNQKQRKVNFTISKVRNSVHPKHLKEKGGGKGKSIMKEKTFALLQ